MKARAYMRVARNEGGRLRPYKLDAHATPSDSPLTAASGDLPTVAFAIDLDIPDAAFDRAEQVIAEIRIPEDQIEIAAEVTER